MEHKKVYTSHALVQMFKRGISREDINLVLDTGVVIMDYPDDKPYPSFLILGFIENRPVHVVYALNNFGDKVIITAYQPDLSLWNDEFKIKIR